MTEIQNNQNAQGQVQGNGAQQGQDYAPQLHTPYQPRPQIQGQGGAEQLKIDHPQAAMPAPAEPVKLGLLTKQKEYTYTDANGYQWTYTFQFPGMRKLIEMYDEARSAAGGFNNSILYPLYLKHVVVSPVGLTLDVFDNRPGLFELMDAVDSFLGEAQD